MLLSEKIEAEWMRYKLFTSFCLKYYVFACRDSNIVEFKS